MAGTVIGRLDRQITFQTFTEAQDATGQPLQTWADLTDVPTVWARLERTSGNEGFTAGHVELAERNVNFIIRHRTDLHEEMRVSYDGELFDIEGIEEIGRADMLRIVTRAQVK